jgi:hypothetical protein
MRRTLIATLIVACLAAGCAATQSGGSNPGRDNATSLDPSRSRSCYGGPVYVPC